MIFAFKLASAPFLVLCLTLLSRRFGPAVGGLLMGVPLITGPISVFTAIENGADLARHAAVGNLIGQMSTCLFCLAYIRAARLLKPWLSVTAGVAVFMIATVIWNQVS